MGVRPTIFQFTAHAKQRFAERNVTAAEAVEAVQKSDSRFKQYKGTQGGWVFLFKKKFGARELLVVAEVFKETCYFITAYWNET